MQKVVEQAAKKTYECESSGSDSDKDVEDSGGENSNLVFAIIKLPTLPKQRRSSSVDMARLMINKRGSGTTTRRWRNCILDDHEKTQNLLQAQLKHLRSLDEEIKEDLNNFAHYKANVIKYCKPEDSFWEPLPALPEKTTNEDYGTSHLEKRA